MSNTKRCSGYKGHWECSEEYPDRMVPVEKFGPDGDGLQGRCRKCTKYRDGILNPNRPRHPETNQLKVHWQTAKAREYYGGMPEDPKTDEHWKECRAMATKDSKSIAWVRPNDSQTSNVIPFKSKEDFGPRTPMTKREPTKVIGKKVPEGWVYIVRNPELPQYLKIGKTFPNGIGDIMSAARRYGRAELVHKEWAEHAEIAEKKHAHKELKEFNLRKSGYTDVGTEVFEVSVEKAIEAVKMACDIVNDPDWDGIVDLGDADDA